jgi:pimeloyl-ACP methyl ester carboxylesterase
MARSTQQFGELAGDLHGDDDERTPLVFLHGLSFDRTIWEPTLAELRERDPARRVLTLDLPGHGGSADAFVDLTAVVAQVHAAIEGAELRAPVIVGHSVSGLIATFYAAGYPCRGVVNVDQPLAVEPFAQFIQSVRPRLSGSGFASVWVQLVESWHLEFLGAEHEAFVREKSKPRSDIALGYWAPVLELRPDETAVTVRTALESVRPDVPYLSVLGGEPGQEYRRWMSEVIPHATIVVLDDSGHFPQLRHVVEFAQLLVSTEGWPATSSVLAVS